MRHVIHEHEIALEHCPGRDRLVGFGCADEPLPCGSMNGGIAIFPPRVHAPAHTHTSDEVIYLLEGCGVFHFDDHQETVEPGCFINVPRGVRHSVENLGEKPLRLLFVFSPPLAMDDESAYA